MLRVYRCVETDPYRHGANRLEAVPFQGVLNHTDIAFRLQNISALRTSSERSNARRALRFRGDRKHKRLRNRLCGTRRWTDRNLFRVHQN